MLKTITQRAREAIIKCMTSLSAKFNTSNENSLKMQWLLLGGALFLAFLLAATLLFFIKTPTPHRFQKSTQTAQAVNFADVGAHVSEQAIWVEKAQNKLADVSKLTQSLQSSSRRTKQTVQSQDNKLSLQAKTMSALQRKVTLLTEQLMTLNRQTKASSQKNLQLAANYQRTRPKGGYNLPRLREDHQSWQPHRVAKPTIKSPKTYVPAGAFLKAIVLQGIDAGASISSQSDPRPVLLRAVSPGTLPGGYHSRLKNCFIIGAGYGDASSERVYVRLESMSCTRGGRVFEYGIFGYISGLDAKAGQHGRILFRDKPFLKRAFIGGVLSGLGNIGSLYSQDYSTSALGTVASVNPQKIPLALSSQGVSNAASMYAQYNIKRAEQYQPIVEFGAGNTVNLVFTKGFWLDPAKEAARQPRGKSYTPSYQAKTRQMTPIGASKPISSQQDLTQAINAMSKQARGGA